MFLPNFPGAMFIQGATFIPDSRVLILKKELQGAFEAETIS